ncbi:MAG: hypothetical protein ACJARS_003561 [bacterium]|jgi:hypothetical protein
MNRDRDVQMNIARGTARNGGLNCKLWPASCIGAFTSSLTDHKIRVLPFMVTIVLEFRCF